MSVCVGVPKEVKPLQGRIAITPAAAAELVRRGVAVGIQRAAGMGAGYQDADYSAAGAQLLPEATADLLVGAVLLPGAAAPRVVSRAQIAQMQPGSVVADISVDQGGCIETTRATTYDAPTYIEEGVQHFCVTNMPGAVPRSATQALSAAVLPYLLALLAPDWRNDPRLAQAINVDRGQVVHPALKSG